ncbi:MAG: hypothetical protein GY797_08445 [Deltaproteobacteria bacterium]|nr:hypothetical protein [Deltaproteobacteria bacterium]
MTNEHFELAKRKISTPAIILMGVSTLSIICLLGSLTFSSWLILSGTASTMEQPLGMTKETQVAIRMTWSALMLVSSIIILFGAFRMKNLDNRTLAMVACVLAIIPCFGPCFILGIPFGIWGLLVLRDGEIRAAFEGTQVS